MDILTSWVIGLLLQFSFSTLPEKNPPDSSQIQPEITVIPTKKEDTITARLCVYGNSRTNIFPPSLFTATLVDTLLLPDNGLTGVSPGDIIEYTLRISRGSVTEAATGTTATIFLDENTSYKANSLESSVVAIDDAYDVIGNMSISVQATDGVLHNDINLDSDGLTVSLASNSGLQGTLNLQANGAFTFIPAAGFRGQTSFTYTVTDGTFSDTGTVTFTVNQMVWFIRTGSTAPGDGRLGTPFSSVTNFISLANDMSGDKIFLYSGTYTAALTLLDRQWLIGQGTTSGSFYSACGLSTPVFPVVPAQTLPNLSGTSPTLSSSSGTLVAAKKNRITGVDVSNTGGTAFSASTFDSLYIRQMSVTNASGPAVTISTGFLDAEFIKINSNGGIFGMKIATTTGSCKVTGSANTDNSGGIIQGFSQRGIDIQNARSIQLQNIKLESSAITSNQAGCVDNSNSSCYSALHASNVLGLSLQNIDIPICSATGFNFYQVKNLSVDGCSVNQTGNYFFENCMTAVNLSGTCSILQSSFSQPASKALNIYRSSNDTLQLTIQNSLFLDSYTSQLGQDLLECTSQNIGLTMIQLTGCRFKKAKTKAIQIIADDSSLIQLSMTDCAIVTDNFEMAGLDVTATGSAGIKYNVIQNDTIQSRGEVAILSYTATSGSMEGRINQNGFIEKTADSTDMFSAIRILQEEGGWGKIEVLNNSHLNLSNGEAALQGISRAAATGSGRLDLTTVGNTIQTDINSLEGIEMRTGSSLTGTENNTGCIRAASNQVTAGSIRAFRSRQVNPSSQLLLQGSGTNINDYWTANSNTNVGGSILGAGTLTFGATCLLPTHSSFQAAEHWITASKDDGVEAELQSETSLYPDPSGVVAVNPPTSAKPLLNISGQQITVGGSGFTLPANKSIIIRWQAEVNALIPPGVCNLASQASIAGSNFSTFVSDDPESTTPGDSTFTDLIVPVAVSCPASVQVAINNSNCTSSQTFLADASGCPAASVTYTINQQTITFPYDFSPGQTLVTVNVTNSAPSSASCTFTVTVDGLQGAYQVGGSDTLCANGSGAAITLADSDTGISYQLFKNGVSTGVNKAGTDTAISFTGVTESGVYTIKGVTSSGCTVSMTDSARVLILSLPNAGMDADTILCGTGTTLLTASTSNGTGMWSVRSGPSLAGGQFASVLAASTQFTAAGGPGTYENLWVVSNGVCPEDTASFSVTVKSLPSALAGNDTTLCLGESVMLRASAMNGTGVWQIVASPSGSTPQLIDNQLSNATFSADKNGTYSLSWNVSETGCPTKRDTVIMTVYLNPAEFLTGNQTICSGMSLMPLLATSATATFSYLWSRDNLQNISGISQSGQDSIPGKLINQTNTAQNVNFTLVSGQCRTQEFTSTVTINPAPVATFSLEERSGLQSNDGILCAGDTLSIMVAGASTYLWGTGQTSQLIRQTPTDSTFYRVQMVSIDGCIASDSIFVKVFQNPNGQVQVTDVSGIANNDAVICLGDSLLLQATLGFTYLWAGGETESSFYTSPMSSQLITVRMTDAVGCSDLDSVQVVVNQLPDVMVSIEENSVTPDDGNVCRGATAMLLASGAQQYIWSTGQTDTQIEVQPQSTATYSVTGTDTLGCVNKDSARLNVKILPNINVSGPSGMVCAGVGGQLTASGGFSYEWSDGQTGATITVNPPMTTTYTVTITDIDGCTASSEITYLVDLCCVKPTLSIGKITQPTCQQGGSIEFSGLPNGNWTLFQRGIIQKVYTSSGNQFTAPDIPEGVYRFQVADENGCISALTPPFQAILVNY